MTKKIINVVAAAIYKEGKLLAMQRSDRMTLPGMWEFPGGKIEEGESHEQALVREIREELEVDIIVQGFVNTASYNYDFGTVEMSTYKATLLSEPIIMKEHAAMKWLDKDQIMSLEWAPVDIPAATLLSK